MGYLHIPNCYKDPRVLEFKKVYALEKIHGTSANVAYRDGHVRFSSGGASADAFRKLFDEEALRAAFEAMGHGPECPIVVHGEAYGGKEQGQSWRYGKELRFVAFDVRIGNSWLNVPNAFDVAKQLSLEFVAFDLISSDVASVNAMRDAGSTQAVRNGLVDKVYPREGVVLRPPFEVTLNNGERLIAKHKRDEERETSTARPLDIDPARARVLADAASIANEWVTEERLSHVLAHLAADGKEPGIEQTGKVISAMVEDVYREGKGEVVESRDAEIAMGRRTAGLFKERLKRAAGFSS